MNKRDRVLAVVQGKHPDYVPASFSMHFPQEAAYGAEAVKAHLAFFKETDLDICKIMNENLLRGEETVTVPVDMARERISDAAKQRMADQVDLVKRIKDSIGGDNVVLATIHGPMVSIHHMSGRTGFFVDNLAFYKQCIQENPQALRQALARAADGLCELASRCVNEAGADGIYFAGLGAEKDLFTDEEYHEYVRPFDLQVFESVSKKDAINVMHICKKGIAVSRFADYPAQIFNWEFGGLNPTMEDGFCIFPEDRVIMGGLDNDKGPLVEGGPKEIESAVHDILRRAQGRRFILGASCTLPTNTPIENIRAAAEACRTYQK